MDSYIWGVILVGMLATFATRALPFVLLSRYAEHPLLRFLGRFLPPVLMVLLVIYATADLAVDLSAVWQVIAATLTVVMLQWFSKNPLISISVGSLVYALLL